MSDFNIVDYELPIGIVGELYQTTFKVEGYPIPRDIVWKCATMIPHDLSLDKSSGSITGTPQETYMGTLAITAISEEYKTTKKKNFNLYIKNKETPLSINEISITRLSCSEESNIELTASGGTPPYKWEIENIPWGMTLEDNYITGTPVARGGKFCLNIKVTDAERNVSSYNKIITIE